MGAERHPGVRRGEVIAALSLATGLPIGVQVIARPWQDHVALAALHAIEHAARQRPDFPLLQNV